MRKFLKKLEVTNITNLTTYQINKLEVGDVVAKKTNGMYHHYVVSYKENNVGICLTYTDASVVETVSYDYVKGNWVYNSTDVTELGGSGATYTAGAGITISNNEISVDNTTIQEKLVAGNNITIASDGKTISATGGSDVLVNVNENGGQIIKNLKVGDVVYENELLKTEVPVGYSFDYEAFVEWLADTFLNDYTFDEKLFSFGISLEADENRRISVGISKQQNSNVIDIAISQNGEFIAKNDDLYLNIETDNISKLSDLYENASVISYFSTDCTLINKIDVNFATIYSYVDDVENTEYISGDVGLYLFTSNQN